MFEEAIPGAKCLLGGPPSLACMLAAPADLPVKVIAYKVMELHSHSSFDTEKSLGSLVLILINDTTCHRKNISRWMVSGRGCNVHLKRRVHIGHSGHPSSKTKGTKENCLSPNLQVQANEKVSQGGCTPYESQRSDVSGQHACNVSSEMIFFGAKDNASEVV